MPVYERKECGEGIIGKTTRDEKKNETGYFVCGASQNETG